ncbi:polyphosphate polymerase domain-containing protein [Puteibacter caeruleilacunae]|nr:polyphosphate polymerase domain-containing protein [Puteibacter caeruleilacunae]
MNFSLLNSIQKAVCRLDVIPLSEISEARLMRRVDTKFVFNISLLPQLLDVIAPNYNVVDINNRLIHDYESCYFDTQNYEFFQQHQRGIRDRYKVRFRRYLNNNLTFFEIKQKTNKDETIKERVRYTKEEYSLTAPCRTLLERKIPGIADDLHPTLKNNFIRITLVHKKIPERVTIDYNISVTDVQRESTREFNQVCIVELKRDLRTKSYDFVDALRALQIHPMGFSKYCMGLILLESPVKSNRFKPRFLNIMNKLN